MRRYRWRREAGTTKGRRAGPLDEAMLPPAAARHVPGRLDTSSQNQRQRSAARRRSPRGVGQILDLRRQLVGSAREQRRQCGQRRRRLHQSPEQAAANAGWAARCVSTPPVGGISRPSMDRTSMAVTGSAPALTSPPSRPSARCDTGGPATGTARRSIQRTGVTVRVAGEARAALHAHARARNGTDVEFVPAARTVCRRPADESRHRPWSRLRHRPGQVGEDGLPPDRFGRAGALLLAGIGCQCCGRVVIGV